jgi:hypothetical protein
VLGPKGVFPKQTLPWRCVNLPHISYKKCIKIVLQQNLFKNTQGLSLSFFSQNLYRRYRWDVKYQNFFPGPQNRYQKCRQIRPTVKFP